MMNNKLLSAAIAVSLSLTCLSVSADNASKLQNELTPLGGERAGNADGSIPAWNGDISAVSSETVGDVPTAIFADEQPLYVITPQNFDQYADKLTPGSKALMEKYPDTFKIKVYPTHRTAIASQWVYDNTVKNVDSCTYSATGMALKGCFGGTPFPMPKTGEEVVWNNIMRNEAQATEHGFKNLVVASDGKRSLATQNVNFLQYPFYYTDSSAEKWDGRYLLERFDTMAPAFKVGESLVIHDSINADKPRAAWQYLVGQRRVRRAPTVGFDTPDFVASGANYFDEVEGFWGSPTRYDWKIVGKKEMIVPYNNNRLVTASVDDAYTGHHYNPDLLRWELHRVWEVEATVTQGKRHAVPTRHYYYDEDSWMLLQMDGYDAEGNLWRTVMTPPFVIPKVPQLKTKPALVFNLEANTSSHIQSLNGEKLYIIERKDDDFYTGEAVAADSVR